MTHCYPVTWAQNHLLLPSNHNLSSQTQGSLWDECCPKMPWEFCLTWRRFLYFISSMLLIELELHHLPTSLASLQLLPDALLTPSHALHNSCYLLFLWLSLLRTSACLFVWISIYKCNLLSPFLVVMCTLFQCWLLYIGKPIRDSSLGEASQQSLISCL